MGDCAGCTYTKSQETEEPRAIEVKLMAINQEMSNWEIFLFALGELGGVEEFVDVEDVYFRCFELAPSRFSWRTRSDTPDYKKCAKALRDAEARRPSLLIKAGNRYSRQLTVEGVEWYSQNLKRARSLEKEDRIDSAPKSRPRGRALALVEESESFLNWKRSGELPTEKWKVADLFMCSQDSPERIWRSRLEILRSAAHTARKKKVLEFLEELGGKYPHWFGAER